MRDGFGTPQVVLLAGGTSAIGTAVAEELVRAGTLEVVLAGRDRSRLEAAAVRLRAAGAARARTESFEALDRDAHPALVERLRGDVDVAILAFGAYGEAGDREALSLLDVNLAGAVSLAMPLAALMRRQGHGTLVFLSSAASVRTRAAERVYAAAKAGLDAYVRGLADDLHGSGVSVLLVRPASVRSPMSAGREPPWSIAPARAGARIARAILAGKDGELWVPRGLGPFMFAVRLLPRPAFRWLSARAGAA